MNMCTVKSIQDAIRECCQSQHDMEPIEIDQIVDNLPFFKEKSLFDTPPLPQAALWPEKAAPQQLTAAIHFGLRLFSCPENRKE